MGCASSTPDRDVSRAQRLRAMARRERAAGNLSSLSPGAPMVATHSPATTTTSAIANPFFVATLDTPPRHSAGSRQGRRRATASSPSRNGRGSSSASSASPLAIIAELAASHERTNSSGSGRGGREAASATTPRKAPFSSSGPYIPTASLHLSVTLSADPPAAGAADAPYQPPRLSAADAPVPTFLVLPDVPMLESQGAASTSAAARSRINE